MLKLEKREDLVKNGEINTEWKQVSLDTVKVSLLFICSLHFPSVCVIGPLFVFRKKLQMSLIMKKNESLRLKMQAMSKMKNSKLTLPLKQMNLWITPEGSDSSDEEDGPRNRYSHLVFAAQLSSSIFLPLFLGFLVRLLILFFCRFSYFVMWLCLSLTLQHWQRALAVVLWLWSHRLRHQRKANHSITESSRRRGNWQHWCLAAESRRSLQVRDEEQRMEVHNEVTGQSVIFIDRFLFLSFLFCAALLTPFVSFSFLSTSCLSCLFVSLTTLFLASVVVCTMRSMTASWSWQTTKCDSFTACGMQASLPRLDSIHSSHLVSQFAPFAPQVLSPFCLYVVCMQAREAPSSFAASFPLFRPLSFFVVFLFFPCFCCHVHPKILFPLVLILLPLVCMSVCVCCLCMNLRRCVLWRGPKDSVSSESCHGAEEEVHPVKMGRKKMYEKEPEKRRNHRGEVRRRIMKILHCDHPSPLPLFFMLLLLVVSSSPFFSCFSFSSLLTSFLFLFFLFLFPFSSGEVGPRFAEWLDSLSGRRRTGRAGKATGRSVSHRDTIIHLLCLPSLFPSPPFFFFLSLLVSLVRFFLRCGWRGGHECAFPSFSSSLLFPSLPSFLFLFSVTFLSVSLTLDADDEEDVGAPYLLWDESGRAADEGRKQLLPPIPAPKQPPPGL